MVNVLERVCIICGSVRLHEYCRIGEKTLGFHFLPLVLLEFMLYLMVLLLPLIVNCKQCGSVRRKINIASTTRMFKRANHFCPVNFSLRSAGSVKFYMPACSPVYKYVLKHFHFDSKGLPHSGIASSYPSIVVLVIKVRVLFLLILLVDNGGNL